ncbi:hypothetical protein H4582DRAFT_2131224 [Lactarius indigo]|nr:hypothetical protein H4582DRAFT_2131216 [Lactarius indigo]KAI9434074.1 hypothetical protein H4582DRAFT_2131224 [Lactarius indigo]
MVLCLQECRMTFCGRLKANCVSSVQRRWAYSRGLCFTFALTNDYPVLLLAFLASPDASSSSIPTIPSQLYHRFTTTEYSTRSSHLADQRAIDNTRRPATSPDPVTSQMMQGGVHIFTTRPLSSPEYPASTPPTSKASTVHVRYAADHRDSDGPDIPSSRSPTPAILGYAPNSSGHARALMIGDVPQHADMQQSMEGTTQTGMILQDRLVRVRCRCQYGAVRSGTPISQYLKWDAKLGHRDGGCDE